MAFRFLRRLRGETIARCFLQLSNPNICASARSYTTDMRNDAFEGHILRLLRNKIQFQVHRFPPIEPVQEFSSFSIDDKPGERWFTLKKKFGEDEAIKVDATMFNAVFHAKKVDADVQFHLPVIVYVFKGEGNQILEFVCSVRPDSIQIHKVYTQGADQTKNMPYTGPKFKELNDKLQRSLYDYLEARGINDDLAVFLHQYAQNKYNYELPLWIKKLKSTIENKNKK